MLGFFTQALKSRVYGIVRVHVQLRYRGQAINAEVYGRYGLHIVTDDALAGGSLPDPRGDSESSWMLNKHFVWDHPTLDQPELEVTDVKAQRRLPNRSTLLFSLENGHASNAMHYAYGIRLLVSLK